MYMPFFFLMPLRLSVPVPYNIDSLTCSPLARRLRTPQDLQVNKALIGDIGRNAILATYTPFCAPARRVPL
jgi:hypothetical protein